jgi:REP element-mobilizing transposase RayT
MRPESVANGQSIKSPTENRAHVKNRAHIGAPLHRQSGSIGSILAGFKSATTKRINQIRANSGCPVWQRNFYERVIRNEHELARAREYIVNNPLKWELDQENPKNLI